MIEKMMELKQITEEQLNAWLEGKDIFESIEMFETSVANLEESQLEVIRGI